MAPPPSYSRGLVETHKPVAVQAADPLPAGAAWEAGSLVVLDEIGSGGSRFLGGTQDNGTIRALESNGPDSWTHIFGGDGGYVAIDPTDPSTLYVEYQWSRIQKSIDGGATFVEARTGITDSPYTFLFITPFVMDPNDSQTLWTGGRRLWRTTDGADLWLAAIIFWSDPQGCKTPCGSPATRPTGSNWTAIRPWPHSGRKRRLLCMSGCSNPLWTPTGASAAGSANTSARCAAGRPFV